MADRKKSTTQEQVSHAYADYEEEDSYTEDEYGTPEPRDLHQDNWHPEI